MLCSGELKGMRSGVIGIGLTLSETSVFLCESITFFTQTLWQENQMHSETGLDTLVGAGLAWTLTGHSRNMRVEKIISRSANPFLRCSGGFFIGWRRAAR